MKAAYLKIVIGRGYDEKIAEHKKLFPEADEVSIDYFYNGKVYNTSMVMDRFIAMLRKKDNIDKAIQDAKAMCHPMHPGMTERDRMDVEAYQLALKNVEDLLEVPIK